MISNDNQLIDSLKKEEMTSLLEKKVYEMFQILIFDVDHDIQIIDSPKRIAKMYVNELFRGCYEEEPKITVFENTKEYNEMVFLGPIEIKSMCSHHWQPFLGSCYIAYIPDKKIVGISKFSRITKFFMRRPQIQEELTKQIANYIQSKLQPKGVGVYIEATHMCMIMRGVEESQKAKMKTSCLQGNFTDAAVRAEFFTMIKG